jgi:D-alanine-D-alanine ligase
MKVAVVYNRSQHVINLFGTLSQEKIAVRRVKRIADALKKGGHQVKVIEGGKNFVEQLEDFMPRVLKGERPGMVFNLSYGIQGEARYTHIPSILEMVGIPYVGSGPLAHSLALDKVVAKMLFRQQGIPTPNFSVLEGPRFEVPDIPFPLIVKPKNEAVSFGLRIVNSEQELRAGAQVIFDEYNQPVLVEEFIEGREINIGLLGNNPPECLPPVELLFGDGPTIYTWEDKTKRSGREIGLSCPAKISDDQLEEARKVARGAFTALGLCDCARVDMRLDNQGNLYVLEVNSLPALGEHASYPAAALQAGLHYDQLINRFVEVASARYFGTPAPPELKARETDPGNQIFSYLVSRRDRIERRLEEWTMTLSRTADLLGIERAVERAERALLELKLVPVSDLTDNRHVWTWESPAGMSDGTLIICHLDVPLDRERPIQGFHREPEWLRGEGIGVSRGPIVMLESALRALRSARVLRRIPVGVLIYTDEGYNCRYSKELIRKAGSRVKEVLVLRPGNQEHNIITQRRGWRRFQFTAEGVSRRPGQNGGKPDVLRWFAGKIEALTALSSKKDRLTVAVTDLEPHRYPLRTPHRITASFIITFLDEGLADEVEAKVRALLAQHDYNWDMQLVHSRPPMKKRRADAALAGALRKVANSWEIPLATESSLYPSVAGLVSGIKPVVCGLGPIARQLYTPEEAIQRISLPQRTLLLAQYLLTKARKKK